jgi:hypothetical protein
MTSDWSDPATRDRLIECVSPDEYNRLHAEQMARSTDRVRVHVTQFERGDRLPPPAEG